MARYVDGFVIPVPRKNIAVYTKMSKKASKVWREHGALEYIECVGDDLKIKGVGSYPRQLKCKPGETVVFSYIVYTSRAHRDRVNAKVMKDPRLAAMMNGQAMPFDVKRMLYAGFRSIVVA
jgi:uncharacterized protein YbaA (DUF1428 family)